MGLLSIGFAYVWLLQFFFFLAWVVVNRKIALAIFLLLLCGIPVFKNNFALNVPKAFAEKKAPGTIRLMQWNCNGLTGVNPIFPEQTAERKKIVAFINRYQPDIICTQDFSNYNAPGFYSNVKLMQDSLGYRHFYYSVHYGNADTGIHPAIGIAIFSKYPVLDSGRIHYPGKEYPETIAWATLAIGNKKIRIGTTHLQSMHLSRNAASFPLGMEQWEDSTVINHGSKLDKLKYFQPYHVREAKYLEPFMDSSATMPFVFTGDLNSTPASFVYHTIRGKLEDAYLEKGLGFGRTYDSWQPALRIDYIFHNQYIQNLQTSLFRTTFSDHDPVIMDFSVR